MRVIVTALAPSHLLCMTPLAWALRSAGHEVLVAGRADVAAMAGRSGLDAVGAGGGGGRRGRPAPAPRVAPPPVHSSARWSDEAADIWGPAAEKWPARVGAVIDDCLTAARYWRADLVLCDPAEFTGLIVGGLLGIPTVMHWWGAPDRMSAEALRRAGPILAPLCAELGLAGGLPRPDLVIDPCPPSLRLPGSHEEPPQPMRFVPSNGAGAVPRWAGAPRGRRRACVSFGAFGGEALANGGELPALLGAVGEALGRDHDVVVPLPPELHRGLGELPPGVRLVAPAPLDSFLHTCDVVVHHGGTGTAMTALTHGLPQIVCGTPHPALAGCGDGLVRRGAAVRVPADGADPVALRAGLRKAADTVSDDERFARNAREAAAENAAQPTPAATVSVLEALVARAA
ncbi:nucleotide disphospho-sugar-binding domain-containing protein [Streptomyces sp. HD]|uniref:nucleotide disphospho-sugar-binding domain-containing protein n=1 Tax=Streptomyces sp. HD TaxID=3020892 RepID=UPI00232A82EE|nr:nucleotide disphospho-sugar-binding domain-containing protein [Streptomyces sp. HD]MDC0772578.1 DUF1205 domain-containing protein [Streptomyces sp. HD]